MNKRQRLIILVLLFGFVSSFCYGKAYISDLTASPNPFSPDADGYQDTSSISFTLSESDTVGVYIFDSAGNSRYTLVSPQVLPSGLNTFAYTGAGVPNLADGAYTVRVETDPNDAFQFISKMGNLENNPYGIDVDSNGYIYVTDLLWDRVYKFTSTGTLVMSIGSVAGSCNGCFNNPYDVGVDSDGNIYVSDNANHRIEKYDSNGNYLATFGQTGVAGATLAPLLFSGPQGIYVTRTGLVANDRIYVADYNNNRVVRLLTDGSVDTAWGDEGGDGVCGGGPGIPDGSLDLTAAGNTCNATDCGFPLEVAVDSTDSDAVWVSCRQANYRVRKFNSLGQGSAFPDIYAPYSTGMAAANGKLFLVQYDYRRTQIYNSLNGGVINTLSNYAGPGNGQVNYPAKAALNASGNVLIADYYNHRIQEVNISSGSYISKFNVFSQNDPQFYYPEGIVVDPSDNSVYVSSGTDSILTKFDKNGTKLWSIGVVAAQGDADTTDNLSAPYGLALDSSGNIYVADCGYDRVMKFDSNGTFLMQISGPGTADGLVDCPRDVAVDSDDNVYIVDIQGVTDRLQKFNSSGIYQAKVAAGILNNPDGVFVIGNGTTGKVFVADYSNQRIRIYNALDLSDAGTIDCTTACTSPYDVTVYPADLTGSLYISSWTLNSIIKMTQAGVVQGAFGGSGHGDTQFYYPSGVSFDSLGNMWVVNRGSNTTNQAPHNVKAFAMSTVATTPVQIDTTQFGISVSSPQTAGTPFNITLTAKDRYGNVLTSYTGTVAVSNNGTGTLSPSTVTFLSSDNGVKTSSFTYNKAETVSFQAEDLSDSHKDEESAPSVTFNPGSLSYFDVIPWAFTQTAGVNFNLTVAAYDVFGNLKTNYTGTAALTASGPGTLGGATSANFIDSNPSDGYTIVNINYSVSGVIKITATSGPVTNDSPDITFGSGALDHFDVDITSPQTAGQGFNVHVTARDALGNKVTSFANTVDFTVASGGLTTDLTPTQSLSFLNGETWITLTYFKTGTITIRATNTATGKTGVSGNVVFNPDTVSYLELTASSPQFADLGFNLRITAMDAWGNTVTTFNQSLAFSMNGGTGTLAPPDSTGYNFVSGIMDIPVTYSKPLETITITATSLGPAVVTGQSPGIDFQIGAQTLTSFTVTASTSTPTAGSSFNVTVTARDQDNLAYTNYVGIVNLSHDGTGILLPMQITIGVGQNGTRTVAATYNVAENGVNLSAEDIFSHVTGVSSALDFQPGAVNIAACAVDSTASVIADGTAQSTVVVTLADLYGNPVPGKYIQINSSRPGDVLVQPTSATDANGQATGYVKSTTAGASTISAVDITDSVDLTGFVSDTTQFTAGAVDHFHVQASTPQVLNQAFNLAITAKDAYDNTVTSYAGTVTLTTNGAGNISPSTATGFASGAKTASVAYDALGLITITATDLGLGKSGSSSPITINNATVDLGLSTVNATVSVTANGTSASTVTITLLDSNGHGIPDKSVVIISSRSSDTLTQPSSLTDANGAATAAVTSTTAGSSTFSAMDVTDNVWLTDTAQTTFTAGSIDHFHVTAATPQVIDEAFTITITAKDAFDNTVTGFASAVNISTDGIGTITPASTNAFITGTASLNVSYNALEDIHIIATEPVSGKTGSSTVVSILNAALSVPLSTVSSTASVTADGVSTATVTITLLDTKGVGMAGKSVIITSSRSTDTITQPSAATGADGITTAAVVSTVTGTSTFTALDVTDGAWLTDTAQTSFIAGAIDHFVVSASSPQVINENFILTISARDSRNNTVTGFAGPVSLSTLGSGVLTPTASGSFTSGTASINVKYDTLGIIQITATDPVTGKNGASSAITIQNAVVSASLSTVSATASVVADGVSTATVTVTVLDSNGNPLPEKSVVVYSNRPGDGINQPTALTNAGGVATASVTSTATGTSTFTARDVTDNILLTDTAQTVFTAGPLDHFLVSASSPQVINASFTLTITALDACNNTVTGFAGPVSLSTGGSGVLTPATAGGFVNGVAAVDVSYDTLGIIQITVTDSSSGKTGDSSPITIQNAVVSATLSTIASTVSVTADGAAAAAVTVTLLDSNGNPVPEKSVVIYSTRTGDVINQSASATGANGRITATVTATLAGTSVFSARDVTDNVLLTHTVQTVFTPGPLHHFAVETAGVQSMGSVFTVTIRAEDAHNNVITDFNSAVGLSGNGTGVLSGGVNVTLSSGAATTEVSYNIAESIRITVTDPDSGVTGQSGIIAVVNQSLQVLDHFNITVPATQRAGSEFSITISARDEDDNIVTTYTGVLNLTSDGSGVLGPATAVFTIQDAGEITVTNVTYTRAETMQITATDPVNSVDGQSGGIVFTAAAVSASGSTISAPSPTPASGAEVSTVTVTLLDGFGNPVPGKAVTLMTSRPGADILSQPSAVTDSQGRTSGGVASGSVGTSTISAYVVDEGAMLTGTTIITFSPYTEETVSVPGGSWQMFSFNASTSSGIGEIFEGATIYRIENGEMVTDPEAMAYPQPGMAYFIYSPINISTAIAGVPPAGSSVDITLHSGWNQVGNPFPAPLAWDDSVLAALGGTNNFVSLSAAESLGWVDGLYYKLVNGEYSPILSNEEASLEVHNGVMIYAQRDLILRLSESGE